VCDLTEVEMTFVLSLYCVRLTEVRGSGGSTRLVICNLHTH